MAGDDVANGLQDILGNGSFELVLTEQFTDYDGGAGHCVAFWPVIYAWTGNIYNNVSGLAQYRIYYQQQLSMLQLQLQASPDDCTKAEIAKLQRFLGIDPNAGLTDAGNWANSSDSHVRYFDIGVLTDIGGAPGQSYLGKLAQDSDPTVALAAQLAIKQGPPLPDTIDQETILNAAGL